MVQTQAKKLVGLLSRKDTWNKSKYGSIIQFCNTDTENRLRDILNFYSKKREGDDTKKCKKAFNESLTFRKDKMTKSKNPLQQFNLQGIRAGAPAGIGHFAEMTQLSKEYWTRGTTDPNVAVHKHEYRFSKEGLSTPKTIQPASQFNPLFSHPSHAISLFYGLEPFMGFHAALAFVQSEKGSPLSRGSPTQNGAGKLAEALRTEFCAWAAAFRRSAKKVTMRLFVGDALAFAHTLHHIRVSNRTSDTANWYRDREQFDVLRLDGTGYGPEGSAPLAFHVIDTSNLQDYLGTLNILVATSKLLAETPSARITTEMMVATERSHHDTVRNMLSGDFISVAALLGLTPVEYCTDSAGNPLEENIISGNPFEDPQPNGKVPTPPQMPFAAWKMTWKRPPKQGSLGNTRLKFTAEELATMLFAIYLKMFEDESKLSLRSIKNIDTFNMNRAAKPFYNRGTLAAFLAAVRENVEVKWKNTMGYFHALVVNDTTLVAGPAFALELVTYSHTLDVFSAPIFDQPKGPLLKWHNMPRTVYITMQIPRKSLEFFKLAENQQTPFVLQCVVEYSHPESCRIFGGIQTGFGQLTTTGRRTDETYQLHIASDKLGWNGSSPMFVSFMVPTWILLPQVCLDISVALHIRPTPATVRLAEKLGFELKVFTANLSDKGIHITRYPPNQEGSAILHHHDGRPISASASFSAQTDGKTTIKTIKAGLPVDTLVSTDSVRTSFTSPWNMQVKLGDGDPIPLDFPLPIDQFSVSISRSQRKHVLWVEGTVSTRTSWMASPCPITLQDGIPVNWHMPHVRLNTLPSIQVQGQRLDWLDGHLKSMSIGHERRPAQDKDQNGNEPGRQDLKVSLGEIFTEFAKQRGTNKQQVFVLYDDEQEDSHILFPSKLRLDLSGRSVVLDTAVIPTYQDLTAKPDWNSWIQNLAQDSEIDASIIPISKEGMQMWRQMVPAWVERCRTWEHLPNCAYKRVGRVPMTLAPGQEYLCRCGQGHFPAKFVHGTRAWKMASPYASRAAISPLFPSRLVGNQTFHAPASRMGISGVLKALFRRLL